MKLVERVSQCLFGMLVCQVAAAIALLNESETWDKEFQARALVRFLAPLFIPFRSVVLCPVSFTPLCRTVCLAGLGMIGYSTTVLLVLR